MPNVIEARTAIRELSRKAQEVADNKSFSAKQKLAMLDTMSAELKTHQDVIATSDRAKSLIGGADSMGSSLDFSGFAAKSTGGAPKLSLSMGDLQALHQAAVTKQNYRVTTKASDPGAGIPALLLPGVVSKLHEPVRLLDFIPTTPMAGPSVEFIQHTSTTGSAGMVARGAAKPEITLNTTPTILTARKIAVHSALPDEILSDFQVFAAYLQQELQRQIADVENAQVLSGDGTGENLTGILSTSGLLTRAVGTDTALDAVEQAIDDLRVGPSYCDADLIVLNPGDFSKLRRSKDSQGRYILNPDPSSDEADSLWGKRVVATTTMAAGTGLVGNFQIGAQGFVREGFTLTMSNQSGTDFTNNLTRYLAEERITLGVARPSAFVKLTGL